MNRNASRRAVNVGGEQELELFLMLLIALNVGTWVAAFFGWIWTGIAVLVFCLTAVLVGKFMPALTYSQSRRL